jgi:hypothetical protein
MPSSFTTAPDFDKLDGWSNYVSKYVVLEPRSKQIQIPTKFGTQDCWECVVWELVNDHLDPHPGIRIFNPKLVSSLDLAYSQGKPLAGFVTKGGRNGNATIIKDDTSPTMELLSRLWDNGNPITDGAEEEPTEEEPF